MRHVSFVSLMLSASILVSLVGCGDNSKGGKSGVLPELESNKITSQGCLNVQTVQEILAGGEYPALKVTTNFTADDDLGSKKNLFHTHAAFDILEINTSEVFPMLHAVQSDCSVVRSQTLSGVEMNYKVVSSSENSIVLSMERPKGDALKDYQKDALKAKMQVIKYEFLVLSPMHLRITSTYQGFDAHCRSKKTLTNTLQTDYYWGAKRSSFPSQIAMSESFYNRVRSAIDLEGNGSTPAPDAGTPAPQDPIDPNAPTTPADPSQPPTEVGTPGVPTDPDPPVAPAVPGQPVESPSPGIFPNPFRTVQGMELQEGYINVPVSEIQDLMSKPLKAEIARCNL